MAKKHQNKPKKADTPEKHKNGKGNAKGKAPKAKLSDEDAAMITQLEQVFGVGNYPQTRRLAAQVKQGDYAPEVKALAERLSARTTIDPVPVGIGLGAVVLAITVALVLLTTP